MVRKRKGEKETNRDREHLRALFLLRAQDEIVGPSQLSEFMGISRAGAMKKMKKVEDLNYGEYVQGRGIRLNKKATKTIRKDIERHHALELFLRESLDLSQEEACKESDSLEEHVSEDLMKKIQEKYEDELRCECGHCVDPEFDSGTNQLYQCHWVKKHFSISE